MESASPILPLPSRPRTDEGFYGDDAGNNSGDGDDVVEEDGDDDENIRTKRQE